MVTKEELYERRRKRLAERSGYVSSKTYNYNQAIRSDAERGMTAAQRKKAYERRQKEYEASSAFNALPFDKKIARRQAITNAKETVKATAKSVGTAIKSNTYFKKMFNPITIAATAAAAVFNLLAKSAKAASESANRLALQTKQQAAAMGATAKALSDIRTANAELKTSTSKLATAIGVGLADVKKVFSKFVDGFTTVLTFLTWVATKISPIAKLLGLSNTGSWESASQALEKQQAEITSQTYISDLMQKLIAAGVGTAQSTTVAETAYKAALNAARGSIGNRGLSEAELQQTEAFKQYWERYSGFATGMNANIFEGATAELLGDDYVPNVTRSAEQQSKILYTILEKLASMTPEQTAEKLADWENAGTLLKSIGQNLYSFDEVISQNAIEVSSKRIEGILQGLEADYSGKDALLRKISSDVDAIAHNNLNSNGQGSGSATGTTTTDQQWAGTGAGEDSLEGTLYQLAGAGVTGWTGQLDGKFGWFERLADAAGNVYETFSEIKTTQGDDGWYYSTKEDISVIKDLGMTLKDYEDMLNSRGSNYLKSDVQLGDEVTYDRNKIIKGRDDITYTVMKDKARVEDYYRKYEPALLGRAYELDGTTDVSAAYQASAGSLTSSSDIEASKQGATNQRNTTVNIYGADLSDERTRDKIARDIGQRIDKIKEREGGL